MLKYFCSPYHKVIWYGGGGVQPSVGAPHRARVGHAQLYDGDQGACGRDPGLQGQAAARGSQAHPVLLQLLLP